MIYFVRHGATEWNEALDGDGNKSPKLQGKTNIPINQKGQKNAENLANQLQDIHFDMVFCSPLDRAMQTCKIVTKGKYDIQVDDRLMERYFGEFEGKRIREINLAEILKDNTGFGGVEKVSEFRDRIYSFLDDLKPYKDKNILVVSHGGVGCFVMAYFCGEPENMDYTKYIVPHAKPIIFEYKEK